LQVLIDLLGKNPAVAVPIVLSRLIAKEAEWWVHALRTSQQAITLMLHLSIPCHWLSASCIIHWLCRKKVKEEMTRVWRKIYEQNYPRSLDHRSFYFKQQEKKNMMAKAMVGSRSLGVTVGMACATTGCAKASDHSYCDGLTLCWSPCSQPVFKYEF
jgi:histone deacetylase complex regulatory component SIN3